MNETEKAKKKIQQQYRHGVKDYQLIDDGDRILVALSGGKDSLLLLQLLARQMRIYKPHIHVEAAHVVMQNIPYETDRSYLQEFCEQEGVKLHILHGSFDESTDRRKTRCFLCAWNRRKLLFQFATDNGFNKIALGHHQDDILVTLLMNMTFEGAASTMRPKMEMEHYPITIIRPLCLVAESLIREVAEAEGFHKQKTLCPYEETTNRNEMTKVFHTLEQLNPEARYSLWKAVMRLKIES